MTCRMSVARRRAVAGLCAGLLLSMPAMTARAGESVSAAGEQLARRLASFGVETRWIAGQRVNWQTGEPNGLPVRPGDRDTHCSAFVASAARQMGIYILRPPDHGTVLLANAQVDWLMETGATQGWRQLDGPLTAQAAANRGDLVVVAYRSRYDDRPGHIAFVYPSAKSDKEVAANGPQVTQAGAVNATNISMRVGFAGHPAALGRQKAVYFAHPLDLGRSPG